MRCRNVFREGRDANEAARHFLLLEREGKHIMEKRYFDNIGKEISLLGFGCMRLPCLADDKKTVDFAAAQKLIDRAYAGGVNYFDTAWPYLGGQSESFIGAVLKKYPRDSFNLATKMPTWAPEIKTPADVERIFAAQLQKCQVDYFDFYLMHSVNAGHYKLAREMKIYEFLKKKKEEGKIRRLGFSFHDNPELLQEVVERHAWDFAQIQLNYIDWEACDAKRQYEILVEHHLPVIVMEPVRGGALAAPGQKAEAIFKAANADASVASWAIRYAASLPGVMTVLSGMNAMEQVEDNLKTMTDFHALSDAEYAVIEKAAQAYKASGTIPCTGCRYCMDCPVGVDIPRVFAIYNNYCLQKNFTAFKNTYRSLLDSQKAHNCVSCGQCMQHCPQGIRIPEHMKEIAALGKGV